MKIWPINRPFLARLAKKRITAAWLNTATNSRGLRLVASGQRERILRSRQFMMLLQGLGNKLPQQKIKEKD